MRKKRDKSPKKYKKSGYEVKFEQMVKEYHDAKETLESMKDGSEEYNKQKNLCESLFASAERFFKQNQ
ncbi:hypothetical protein RO095_001533 [Vibrio parahaemolyticus]|nr:hypothetical protein [Vibrio parahaemolyticus]